MEQLKDLRILIVEDDETNLKLLQDLLMLYGCNVTGVTTGEDGLRHMQKGQYNIALVDINLGHDSITGTEMLKKYLNSKPSQPLKTMALTAYPTQHDRKTLLQEGFDAYLSKPFLFDDFLGKLQELSKENHRPNS